MKSSRVTIMVVGGAFALAGFGAGAVLATTGSVSAASSAVGTGVSAAAGKLDPSKSIRSDEHLLTGTTAGKVKAAALAKYPNATVQRVETDSDGVYEAHLVTSAGKALIVAVGKDFAVTGTDTMGGPGGGGGPGHGDHDGDGPAAPPSTSGGGA